MLIKPKNPDTYHHMYAQLERDRQAEMPKDQKTYIERNNQPPISSFLNVSTLNHQGIPTRIGHLSLSMGIPIQFDVLAWHNEQYRPGDPRSHVQAMKYLREALILDLVHVADTRLQSCLKQSA